MRFRFARTIVVIVAALFVAAPAVFAQAISPLDPPDTTRYLKWGPFRVRPGLTIPNLGYDSNVFYRPEGSGLPQEGDYFIALSPRIQGVVLFGHRAFLTFDERIEFYAYAHEHDLNYFNQLGGARLTIPFRRFGFYGDIGYIRVRDRPIEAQDARPIRKEFPVGAGVILKLGWRTDAELGLIRTAFTAEDPDQAGIDRLNDRVEKGTRLRARYLAFGRTRVLLDSSQRTIRFDDPATATIRDGKERRALLGLDFGLGGRVFGTVRAGWAAFDLVNPAATGFHGVVGDVALGYSFGGSGSRLTLVGARDVRYSIYEASNLYVYTGADLSFIKYFNRFLGAELGAGRATLDFLGDLAGGRLDVYSSGTVGVRFRISENDLGRRVEYAFRYTRWNLNSNVDSLDQNRGTIGFGMSFGY
jgi:hypothetical protein